MDARVRRLPCKECGKEKEPGRAYKYCRACSVIKKAQIQERFKDKQRDPCIKCGDPKRLGSGQRYCEECYELQKWLRKTKRSPKVKRLCRDCKTNVVAPKRQLCDECKYPARICERCPYPVRSKHKKLCQACYDVARIKDAEYKSQWAKDHPWKGKKKKPTKAQRLKINETRRLDYRMTHNVTPLSEETYRKNYAKKVSRLPAAPLAERIEVYLSRGGSLNELARVGSFEEKRVREAYNGQIDTVRIDIADKVCIALGTTLELVYAEGALADGTGVNGDLCA